MPDDRPRRPGTQSDEDRALAELQRRRAATPPHGVVLVDEIEFGEQPTPPPVDPQELIKKLWPLRHADEMFTEHAAKLAQLEERTTHLQRLAGGLAELGEHAAEDAEVHRHVTAQLADIHGASGQNGKLGELRRRVDSLSKALWWVLTAAVGGLGAAAVKLVMVVRAFDAVEARSLHNAQQLVTLQSQVMTLQAAAISRRYRPAETPERNDSP